MHDVAGLRRRLALHDLLDVLRWAGLLHAMRETAVSHKHDPGVDICVLCGRDGEGLGELPPEPPPEVPPTMPEHPVKSLVCIHCGAESFCPTCDAVPAPGDGRGEGRMKLQAGPIKALSLRQPWLFAIFDLAKRIENRVWPCSYRGPIWLHAAKGMTTQEVVDAIDWMSDREMMRWFDDPRWPGSDHLDRGGVCGYAEIDGLLYPDGHPMASATLAAFRSNVPDADEILRWKMPEQYGFVLRNVKHFPLLRCAGKQRWFYLPPDIERAARAAVVDDVCPCESDVYDIGHGHLASCRFSDPNYQEAPF